VYDKQPAKRWTNVSIVSCVRTLGLSNKLGWARDETQKKQRSRFRHIDS